MIRIERIPRMSLIAALWLWLPVLAACGTTGTGATINVGTKDFAEEYIVGNMYKLLLEDVGFKVNRQPGESLTAWFISFGQAF